MRKLVICLVIVMFLIGFVSAGLVGNIWSKITGKAVEGNISGDEADDEVNDEVNGGESEPDEPVEEFCGDGVCQSGEICDRDCCEAFCTLYCPNGAVEGSCGCECVEVNKECDEGEIRYYTCEDGTEVPECKCENGGWVCAISPKENCPDGGVEPTTCAANIQITFNKEVYKIGDSVKIMIEIFDAEGNRLPNYDFYGAMYDDRWHTPSLHKTDDEGYFIHTEIAEKLAGGATEVIFKIYTKETGSCSSVEDTETIKVELGGCGIGECAPEPECEDKIRMCGGECNPCPEDENGEEKVFYSCNGCELDDKCYTYGYRKNGNFCSDENNLFISQLEDNAACENNFECKTNLCINGNCVSSNIWNKFLEWFKNTFGGEERPKECSRMLIERDIGNNEYLQSEYGIHSQQQVPIYSEDGENIGTVKCCMADYSTGMVLVCPFDEKEDVTNSIKWILAKGDTPDSYVLDQYKEENVINIGNNGILAWTSENYILASGGKEEAGNKFVEEIADAYLKRYSNDFDLTEDDIPYVEPEPTCEEITDSQKQAECYLELAIKNKDYFFCEQITSVEYADKCYISVAESLGNTDICDRVSDENLREKCYFWIAEGTGSDDFCAGITDIDLQKICYVETAEKTEDAKICEKIIDTHIRDKCYREVARVTNDVNLCEQIISQQESSINPKDECYMNIGIQTNDRSLCEKIIWDEAKQKCIEKTS